MESGLSSRHMPTGMRHRGATVGSTAIQRRLAWRFRPEAHRTRALPSLDEAIPQQPLAAPLQWADSARPACPGSPACSSRRLLERVASMPLPRVRRGSIVEAREVRVAKGFLGVHHMNYDEVTVGSRTLFAFWTRSLRVAAAFACATVVCVGVMPAQLPSPTKKALAGHVPVLFPTVVAPAPSTGSFEAGLAANTTLRSRPSGRSPTKCQERWVESAVRGGFRSTPQTGHGKPGGGLDLAADTRTLFDQSSHELGLQPRGTL